MKSQQINKVDLSLDDIIKMDGLGQPQEQNRGGNNRGQGNQQNRRGNNRGQGNQQNRGGNNRGQGNQQNRGQGQRGFRNSGQQGGGGQGISPLNRDKPGTGVNTMTNRGQSTAGSSGQRPNGRAWFNKPGGGGRQWGGSGFSGGANNNNMKRQNNNRPFNFSRQNRTAQGGTQLYNRGLHGNNQQGTLQRRGMQNSAGGIRQQQGGLRSGAASDAQLGGMGQGGGHGGGVAQGGGLGQGGGIGQGNLRIRVNQTGGQGQAQQGLKQMSFEDKRRMAMQALREARKTIAQLDQQAARDNVVNSRRGLTPQPTAPLPTPALPYQNAADNRYGSNLSLASDSSESSSSSEQDLPGRQITSFNMTDPGNSVSRQKRWKPRPIEEDHLDSTLTISIDNSAPFVSHSDLPSTAGSHGSPNPQLSPPAQQWTQPAAHRRPAPYRQPHASRHSHSRLPHQLPVTIGRHSDRPHNWQLQQMKGEDVERPSTSPDLRRGATASFSRQLAQLKPTVAMRYVFQKKTFSAASTPVSLNDRFSEPEGEGEGRKVFM